MSSRDVVFFAGLLTSALMAGLFFAWMVSVIPGTLKTSDQAYVSTMQNINREIINPWFVIPFMTTPLVLAAASFMYFRAGQTRRGAFLAAAAATYAVGVIGITVGGNIPLNDELEAFELVGATRDALAEQRVAYEGPWNRWHNMRTLASVMAFSFAGVAALLNETE